MIVLDTDHLSLLQHRENPRSVAFRKRLSEQHSDAVATTIISLEEQTRGWLSLIRRFQDGHRQVQYYERLIQLLAFYANWTVLPFNDAAAARFDALRKDSVRIGTMDLKIAAITLVEDAILLSSNLKDFEKVPGLRVDDWVSR